MRVCPHVDEHARQSQHVIASMLLAYPQVARPLHHVPLRLIAARQEFGLWVSWYNQERPHQALNGRTPDEVWYDRTPANEQPRLELRRNWPRDSLCASPWAAIDGRRGARADIEVTSFGGRKHLPVIRLKRSA